MIERKVEKKKTTKSKKKEKTKKKQKGKSFKVLVLLLWPILHSEGRSP